MTYSYGIGCMVYELTWDNMSTFSTSKKNDAQQAGISLIVVLWLLVVMTMMVMSFSFGIRTEVMLASNYRSQAQALSLAESAVWRGVAMVLNKASAQSVGQIIRLEGSVYELDTGDTSEIKVSLQSSNGLIDLNRAPAELIKGLLLSVNIPQNQSEIIVDSLLDWRDADNLKHLSGAESADYTALGLSYGAKNGLINSVDELARIHGVDDELFDLLSPLLTVYSGQSRIAIASAPRKVLLTLPGMTVELVDNVMLARDRNIDNINLDLIPEEARGFIGAGSDEYIRVSGMAIVNNAVSGIIAEIQFVPSTTSPVTIVSWFQEIDTIFEEANEQ